MVNAVLEFLVGILILYIFPALSFLWKLIHFPLRVKCLFVGHNDYFQGGGFLFGPKYSFYCKCCKRETNNWHPSKPVKIRR